MHEEKQTTKTSSTIVKKVGFDWETTNDHSNYSKLFELTAIHSEKISKFSRNIYYSSPPVGMFVPVYALNTHTDTLVAPVNVILYTPQFVMDSG